MPGISRAASSGAIRRSRACCNAGSSPDETACSFAALGFRVEAHPMDEGTPFANVLLVARL